MSGDPSDDSGTEFDLTGDGSDIGTEADLDQLAEVERAMASLQGRDPGLAADSLKARLEAEKNREAIQRVIAEAPKNIARARRAMIIKVVGLLTSVGVIGAAGYMLYAEREQAQARRTQATAAADAIEKPFLDDGFMTVTSTTEPPLEAEVTADSCYVATGATLDGAVALSLEGSTIFGRGEGSIGFCACSPQPIKVSVEAKGAARLSLLKRPVSTIGGRDRWKGRAAMPAAMADPPVKSCSATHLDTFITAATLAPPPKISDPSSLAAAFALEGFDVTTGGATDDWLVVPSAAEQCQVIAPQDDDATLTVRALGGEIAFEGKGSWARCNNGARVAAKARAADGSVVPIAALSAPLARLGGIEGLRATIEATGRADALTLADNEPPPVATAKEWLKIAGIHPDDFRLADNDEASVIVVRTDKLSTLLLPSRGAACEADLDPVRRYALCVVSSDEGREALPGIVGARRPVWLPAAEPPDNRALERDVLVLALSQALLRQGFEKVPFEGAGLSKTGVTISPRSGDKDAVAILVTKRVPFVHTLSATTPWDLGDEPEVIDISGGAVELAPKPRWFAPPEGEVMVWRRGETQGKSE